MGPYKWGERAGPGAGTLGKIKSLRGFEEAKAEGMVGNFYKIERKGLLVSEIQF